MGERHDDTSAKGSAGRRREPDRHARRAAALRENLRKRKAQSRGRRDDTARGADDPDGD